MGDNSMDARELMLKELTEAAGLPGYEQEIRSVMKKFLEPLAEIEYDNLGSIIGRKVGKMAVRR